MGSNLSGGQQRGIIEELTMTDWLERAVLHVSDEVSLGCYVSRLGFHELHGPACSVLYRSAWQLSFKTALVV